MLIRTRKNTDEVSFHESTVIATVNDLIFIFGKPTYYNNTGRDKVNIEWALEDENGNIVTIYDWKEYRKIGLNREIEWHIGGISKEITDKAKEEIELVLSYKTSSIFI